MMISVLLPFYNVIESLEDAVVSIQTQTCQEWELLLLDDGSTDGSSEIAQTFSERDERIRWIPLSHGGIVSALNRGWEQAKGNYIARMDADDLSHPMRLEKQVAYLQKHPEVGVVGCQVAFGGDREAYAGYAAHVDWVNGLLTPEEHFANRFVDATVAHPSVMWRSEIRGRYMEGDFPEDFELWLRWMEQGIQFAKVPEILLNWRDSPDRLSRKDPRYSSEAFYNIKCDYLNACLPRDRPILLWGAGRVSRRRFSTLSRLNGYIDVDSKKIGKIFEGIPVLSAEEIPKEAFVISGVGNRGIREKIQVYLRKQGRLPVRDFLLAS